MGPAIIGGMQFYRALVVSCWMFVTPFCRAASLDFAISTNLVSLYNRFGVDSQGNILIAANPGTCALPVVNPLYTCGPIWIGKLDASGQTLLFATYLGNGKTDSFTSVAGIAADSNGNVMLAATTVVQDMPTVNAFQSAPKSKADSLYLAKLSTDGSQAHLRHISGRQRRTKRDVARC